MLFRSTRTYRRNKKSVTLKENVEIEGYDTGRADVEFKEMLMSLPEDSRTIFQLYFGEQFTTKEIAEILSLKENTVKSRIHRGKEQLRMSLLQE